MEKQTSAIIVPVVAFERKLQIYRVEDVSPVNDLKNMSQDKFDGGWKLYFGNSQLFFDYSGLKSTGFDVGVNKESLNLVEITAKFFPKLIDKSKPALAQMEIDDFVIKELWEITKVSKLSNSFHFEVNEPLLSKEVYVGSSKNVERSVSLDCIRRPIAYQHLNFSVTEAEYKTLDLLAQMPAVLHASFELKK